MSAPAKRTISKSPAERMSAYRRRMREKGYVQKSVWVLDSSRPDVVEYYRKSALAIAADTGESDVAALLDAAQTELLRDEPRYDWGDAKS